MPYHKSGLDRYIKIANNNNNKCYACLCLMLLTHLHSFSLHYKLISVQFSSSTVIANAFYEFKFKSNCVKKEMRISLGYKRRLGCVIIIFVNLLHLWS